MALHVRHAPTVAQPLSRTTDDRIHRREFPSQKILGQDKSATPGSSLNIIVKTTLIWTSLGTALYAMVLVGVARAAGEETAPYEVVDSDGKFEIRDYPALTVASTISEAGDKAEADRRFMKLFRYISGGNEGEKKISMTTPVFMKNSGDQGKMSFVLPAEVAEAGAPKPTADDVIVEKTPPQRFAVYRFSGTRSARREDEALKEISAWIKERGLKPAGEPTYAYYNSPWTPGFMRRNEVLIPIGAKETQKKAD